MLRKWWGLLLASFILVTSHGEAQTLAFSRNARTFETQQSSIVVKGMAHACLAAESIPDSLPCNPSLLPKSETSGLFVRALLSNGYSALETTQKLLKGNVTQDFIDRLFSGNNVTQVEGNAELSFTSKFFSGRFTPTNIKLFSVVRNEANPDVELYAIEEQNFTFQGGAELYSGLHGGVQLRFSNRKFIRQRFKLTAILTDAGKDLLKPKKQDAFYIEPGLTYTFANRWNPRISLLMANLGSESQTYDELPIDPELQIGASISPPFAWGRISINLDYKSLNYEEEGIEKMRVGLLYHMGALNITGGFDANGISGGFYYAIENLSAGILFATTQVPGQNEDAYTQTVYTQLGWQM